STLGVALRAHPSRNKLAPTMAPPIIQATLFTASLLFIAPCFFYDYFPADRWDYRLRLLSSPTAKSTARAVRAMYVSDGFTHEPEVIHAPSVTNTFNASQTWLWPLSTEVFGSRPIRAVPISWIPWPKP